VVVVIAAADRQRAPASRMGKMRTIRLLARC
jgi:hypothetical protein